MAISNENAAFIEHYNVNLYTSSGCAIILTILLSLDVFKAFKRKAHWIPVQALVLTALIIQMLTLVDNYLNLNVNSDNFLRNEQMYLLIRRPMEFDTMRAMICIFIGYLLPGVARSGLRTVWGDIGALALPVMWHMCYEIYFLLQEIEEEKSWIPSPPPPPRYFGVAHPPPRPFFKEDAYTIWQHYHLIRVWFRASYITFFTALTLLIVLLTCVVIAGKTIRMIRFEKIPLALSCSHDCNNIESHVLKCFIVTRASQPDYIIARSPFSAFAGMVNTVCFVFIVVKWIWKLIMSDGPSLYFYMQFVFILIGWIVHLFRWFTAVMYFPKNVRCLFHSEFFWTRAIVDMKTDLDAHLTTRSFRKKRILERIPTESVGVNLITAVRLHSLFFIIGLWLLKFMVLVSKVCWCLSDLAFRMIRPFIMSPQQNALLYGLKLSAPEQTDPFHKYKEALEIIRMPGEIAYSLWIANLSAFKKAQNSINEGFKKSEGTACAELVALMKCKTGPVEDETPTSLEVENQNHYRDVVVKSWKMRAVSAIHFMICFYDPADSEVVKDSIKAYSQAWCFMDLFDSLDPKGHLVSLAADKEFDTIEKIWKKTGSKLLLKEEIIRPLKERMVQSEEYDETLWEYKVHDSQDRMAVVMEMAATKSLYKTGKAMKLNSNPANAIHKLRCLLANLIAHCIERELDKAVKENCRRWAMHGKEKEIMNAAFLVGQAKAVREQPQI